MHKRLESLRAQRDLIQKHLDWLEGEITEASKTESDELEKKAPAPTSSDEATITQEPAEATTTARTPTTVNIPEEDTNTLLLDQDVDAIIPKAPQVGNDIFKAKVGCLLIFIAATLLFLFLLFGLPYFMD